MPARGRAQTCGKPEAKVRLSHAVAFLDAAELLIEGGDELAGPNVAASLAILAGIAAADAACCVALGMRAVGQDHKQAANLLAQLKPAGPALSRDLRRLLELKGNAQYGVLYVTSQRASAALRQAGRVIAAASDLLAQ